MSIPFSYQPFPLASPDRLRPMIRVTLQVGSTVQDFDALVDSGSDVTLSHVDIGVPMGITFECGANEKKRIEQLTGLPFEYKISGIGSEPVNVYVVQAIVLINGKRIEANIHWIKGNFNPGGDFPIVLGQDTIFSLFDINFSKRQHKFFLSEEVVNK